MGACPKCRGFGRVIGIDWGKVIPDESLSLAGGAIAPFAGKIYSESLRDLLRCAGKAGVPADVSWRDLDARQRAWVIDGEPGYGTGNVRYPKAWYGVKEFFKWLENTSYKMHVRVFLSRWRSYATCDECGGARLRPEALCWQWNGRTLPALYALPVTELLALLRPRNAPASRHPADQALAAAVARLGYLEDVGLGYLTLDRQSRTLSGGEAQRVNLTTCLGAALADALFVLDEPSIGLHPRDLDRMTGILRRLVAQGNTVVVVEHDESVMRAADFLVEIGPQPGAGGGRLVYAGNVAGIGKAKGSATGAWLSGRRTPVESRRRSVEKDDCSWWRVAGITSNNLRDFAVEIPLQRLVGLCGVSGSGKSSLVEALAGSALSSCGEATALSPRSPLPAPRSLPWSEAALIDQSPVSKTPRSNPALYSGAWDAIRKRLAADPAADAAGLTASHFSFNSGDGRCPHCGGSGWESVEMQFLADVHVPCPICDGHRFRPEILAFKHRGKTVSEILAMTISEALEFFADTAGAVRPLALLDEVGLGYLALGQPLNTLSGGEAQRLKLVRFLGGERGAGSGERGNSARNKKRGDVGEAQRSQSSPPVAVFCPLPLSLCPSSSILSPCSPLPAPCSLLLLDEPTTGLHRDDIARLIGVLQRLVDAGNTLFVVEHNADVLNACDYLLELGPGAGAAGGQLIAAAPPRILAAGNTPTAPYLRR
ncbi:MAG: ATP-binding cassette domain-containing protein [Puniceicoccales bacterium]|nr:ATP-binding cassette domain-containing protein [Puniceicoccales bacterium]